MKFAGLIAVAALCFGTSELLAQEEEEFHYEFTVSAIGAFTAGVKGDGIHQTASSSGGVLATYRYLINKFNGIEVDYSHAQFTQQYLSPELLKEGVHSDLDEFTAAYIVRYPFKRIAPYLTAGTGAVLFSPSHLMTVSAATRQVDATFAYGAGIDVRITSKIAFRVGYRGLVYNAPDFDVPKLNSKSVTNLAEPIGGFSIRL